jgi:hypothetical protein
MASDRLGFGRQFSPQPEEDFSQGKLGKQNRFLTAVAKSGAASQFTMS